MKNIKTKLSRLKLLMKLTGLISISLLLFLNGCAYRSGWEGDRDGFVGKKIYLESIFNESTYMNYGRFFYNWNAYKGAGRLNNRKFDRIESEGKNTRYYITYGGPCKYSILLDENNVMLSWRYETKHRSRCTVH